MTVKIVLSENEGAATGSGTRVYTETGHEIIGISAIDIRIRPCEVVVATIEVLVSEIENLEAMGIFVARESEDE